MRLSIVLNILLVCFSLLFSRAATEVVNAKIDEIKTLTSEAELLRKRGNDLNAKADMFDKVKSFICN